MRLLSAVTVMAVMLTGCTHTQLRHNTAKQSESLTDLFEKQVLDNLARFACDPHALPHFAFPGEGTSNVTDEGTITGEAPLNPFFTKIGLEGTRHMEESWGLVPVTDPEKLKRMRCAYQRAVGHSSDDGCVKCCEMEQEWRSDDKYDCDNDACSIKTGWYRVGRLKDVSKDCSNMVGKYCETYVWIPCEGRDEFAKLVLTILDYAVNEPPAKPMKEVVLYLNADGTGTAEQSAAHGTIKAVIAIDKNAMSLINPEEMLPELKLPTKRKTDQTGPGVLRYEQRLRSLTPNQ